MHYMFRLFTTPRHPLFRPSAIAVGWLLAQILEQYWRTKGIGGTCGDGTVSLFCNR